MVWHIILRALSFISLPLLHPCNNTLDRRRLYLMPLPATLEEPPASIPQASTSQLWLSPIRTFSYMCRGNAIWSFQDELFDIELFSKRKRMPSRPLSNQLPVPICVGAAWADSSQPMKWKEFTLSRLQDTRSVRASKLLLYAQCKKNQFKRVHFALTKLGSRKAGGGNRWCRNLCCTQL